MKNRNFLSVGLLFIPFMCAVLALVRYNYWVHVAVPVACAILICCLPGKEIAQTKWLLVAALVFSIAGDWMLKNRGGNASLFVAGIVLFFIAHIGFLFFCLTHGKMRWCFLIVLIAGYGLFFVYKLLPVISSPALLAAVLLYMLISCFSLAAASGLRLSLFARRLFTAGIVCLVFSDTLIARCEFLHKGGLDHLIMPAYYAAHVLITVAVVVHAG
jgi:uncharacterized membrane protein YhhN